MVISEKTKAYLIGALLLVSLVLLIHFVGEIVLPFIFAIFIAHLVNPFIVKVQGKIPNRNLAVTTVVLSASTIFIVIVFFFGSHIVQDSKRLVSAVDVFVEQHEDEINEVRETVGNFVGGVYESDAIQKEINSLDTLSTEAKEADLTAALEKTYSFLSSSGDDEQKVEDKGNDWNGFIMFLYTIAYLIMILYTFDFFQTKYAQYTEGRKPIESPFHGLWTDFKKVFVSYFRQRTKVVFISMAIFIIAFSIIDLPGAIIIGIITGLLTYATNFHYLSLPIVAIGCWVLSIETSLHFFLFFGILLAVYILISVLEETVFFNRIMKSVKRMNPAVMILGFSFWIYLLGGFVGTVLALPLTQLVLIYLDRVLIHQKESLSPPEKLEE